MDTRRYILAIGLSMLVLIAYMRFFAPQPPVEQPAPQHPQQQTAAAQKAEEKAPAPHPKTVVAAKAIAVASKSRDIIIETDVIKAVVNTAGGVITKWELKDYREADKEEVGFMVTVRKLFGGEKKAKNRRSLSGTSSSSRGMKA